MKLDAYLRLSKRTATEIARECGVSVPTISRLANGQALPSLELAGRLRDATAGAVTADDFLPPYAPDLAAAK